jgi:hypothetical protein
MSIAPTLFHTTSLGGAVGIVLVAVVTGHACA